MTGKKNSWRRAVLGLALAALLSVPAAEAHHGWSSYNTQVPLYLEGTRRRSQWRNPHPELVVVIEAPARAVDPSKVSAAVRRGRGRSSETRWLARKPPVPGRYAVHLPPIARLERAGVSAPPKAGERLVAIAYASCSEAGTARAAFIGLRERHLGGAADFAGARL